MTGIQVCNNFYILFALGLQKALSRVGGMRCRRDRHIDRSTLKSVSSGPQKPFVSGTSYTCTNDYLS